MIFSIRPNSCPVYPQPDQHTTHLMSCIVSPLSFLQPITFFLPATLTRVAFHAVGSCAALLASCSSSLSRDFLYFFFFKMTSCASLIKSNKRMQSDTFLLCIYEATRSKARRKQVKI
jgi:hypothetical protein